MTSCITTTQVITTTDRRGAEVFGLDLGEALRARGRAVTTVALVRGRGHSLLQVPTLGRTRLGLRTLASLRETFSSSDVVVAHGSSTLPACFLASLGTGVPFIYRSVGDPTYWGNTWRRRARAATYLSRAAAVVALTSAAAAALNRTYRVPGSKLHIIPKGVPAARFPPVDAPHRAAARSYLGLEADASVVAYVGALSPEKNVAAAVRAIGGSDTHLVIVGDGPDRRMVERVAREVAPGRVQLLGMVDNPGLVLAAANAVVLPSLTEGLPGVLIEAGLTGLPVVATDVGWVREIVVDGETGIVVPPGDDRALRSALEQVLSSPDNLGTRAREHCVARFDIGDIAARWDALLQSVAAKPAPRT